MFANRKWSLFTVLNAQGEALRFFFFAFIVSKSWWKGLWWTPLKIIRRNNSQSGVLKLWCAQIKADRADRVVIHVPVVSAGEGLSLGGILSCWQWSYSRTWLWILLHLIKDYHKTPQPVELLIQVLVSKTTRHMHKKKQKTSGWFCWSIQLHSHTTTLTFFFLSYLMPW